MKFFTFCKIKNCGKNLCKPNWSYGKVSHALKKSFINGNFNTTKSGECMAQMVPC